MSREDTQFKKGITQNPGGRPRETITLKQLRKIARSKIIPAFANALLRPADEIINFAKELQEKGLDLSEKESEKPTIELIARIFAARALAGSVKHLEALLKPLIGSPPVSIIPSLDSESDKPKKIKMVNYDEDQMQRIVQILHEAGQLPAPIEKAADAETE